MNSKPDRPNKERDRALSAANASAPPSINLPKGGGAINGIGEKFAANPVTGSGSMTIPITTSPGRSGFGPHLSLSYDSGAGNGPFGFGWSLTLPSVTRKTDKGLPQYRDEEDSDVFILSGAEDLVPVYRQDPDGNWVRDQEGRPVIHEVQREGYTVRRYRPRIEGLFARIERWSNVDDPFDVHWRSISKDNVLTLYGKDANSRIFDPESPTHIFSWLICETRDDKGNCVLYEYKPEDGTGVDIDRANECNRGDVNDARRTANRYLKHIRYGNRIPLLDDQGQRSVFLSKTQIKNIGWMFQVVFDYGEHDPDTPKPDDAGEWDYRADPFSSYRATFEVRTTRLCQRVLMFHHFPDEPEVGNDCLVRSTDFTYAYEQEPSNVSNPVYTFLRQVIQSGYKRNNDGYLKRSLPPVEFEYTKPEVQDTMEEVDPESLKNLPAGLDGATWRWTDLHGEGIPGILTEQADAWFYKRNLSPLPVQTDDGQKRAEARFAALETVAVKPNLALAAGAQFMDLAGDGQPDLVVLEGPEPGFYEHDDAEGWQPFRPFTSRLNRNFQDPNTKLIDLNGDGHADVLITEDEAFVWHPSLAEAGFGPAGRVAQALDEEQGPRLVFADGTQSIFTADLSGDGLIDLVRIRNGEVCYWPNLGYARFGTKVTMDNAPWFDSPDRFDHKRIRLADIDGSGTTDIIYLHGDGVRLYFNQSGNGWSKPQALPVFPHVDDLVNIMPVDLLGNGTACLVWSSPLPGDTPRPMRYVNLMGGRKPYLLVRSANNLGAETRVQYAPSTKFYLQDKRDGKPWITRLPFPVHVVERVETYDHISRNRFVTRYAYHHGYFDGEEREFRGFGMVEQWDTEEIGALEGGEFPSGNNCDAVSHVPPVHTQTWFHTGVYLGRGRVSNYFAGLLDEHDAGEYYREPWLSDEEARKLLLDDTILPDGLTTEEEREACRTLKGMMLRQEVYADDGTDKADYPYTVTEQNFTVRLLQPREANRHAVFFAHPREAINYHYERNPSDPRIQHTLTLEVDDFGNVLKSAAIGRPDITLSPEDREKQTRTLITYTANDFTIIVDEPDAYRTPLPAETRTYELTGFTPEAGGRFSFDEWTRDGFALLTSATEIPYEETADFTIQQKRLIERVRTLYRPDDLGTSSGDSNALLPLRQVQSLAVPGETYRLAFTPGLLQQVFRCDGTALVPDPVAVLGSQGADQGGYVDLNDDGHWWIPSGRIFYSPDPGDIPAQELGEAQAHFFMPRCFQDAFGQSTTVTYDEPYDLLVLETRDPLGNRITAGERDVNGAITRRTLDYRVLQPWLVSDPNRNRSADAFDALGLVVGTAVMGKPEESLGDSLAGFRADLTQAKIDQFLDDPSGSTAATLLGNATTRIVYDLTPYWRESDPAKKPPAVAATLTREIHLSDLQTDQQSRIQVSLTYSDGFGREIQKKIQAEPGSVPLRDDNGNIVVGADNQPLMTDNLVNPRWVGSGWTIFNNKGKPVRKYEPFFTDTHRFEFDVRIGVSPVLFYDPLGRVVATLHPNHSWEKVIFDPWRQQSWDVNDTVLIADPGTDPDMGGFFVRLPEADYLPTWYSQRINGHSGLQEQQAAQKTEPHADTPTTVHFDTLGRPFLTIADNGLDENGTAQKYETRVVLDIEGNQRAVRDGVKKAFDDKGHEVDDPLGRLVMRYDYSMAGPDKENEEGTPNLIHQASMEAGQRWTLNDIMGNPIRSWDSRGHCFRTEYDPLRRPIRSFVTGVDHSANPNQELLTERLVYGEQHPEAEQRNLRTALNLHLDQAGAVTTETQDFKGNPLRTSRRIAIEYKQAIDWKSVDEAVPPDAAAPFVPTALEAALAPLLEDETYTSLTTYDALNRPVTLTTPHTPAMQPNVIRPVYNEANLLERVDANLRGETSNDEPVWTAFVTNIDYDARGQRQRIDYGNGVSTFYDYDPLTLRLRHLLTRRNAETYPDDCPQPPPAGWPGCQVQNLHYTYDPAGNITHIRDEAQQTIYFRNRRVEPSTEYTYDALYRLIEASGREHLGQNNKPIPHSHDDALRTMLPHPGDGNAMGTYIERYVYDAVGNFLNMQHRGSNPVNPGWTRTYFYEETSLIEDGTDGILKKRSNRLSRTTVGNGSPIPGSYTYDAHGNMISMPHLSNMEWDFKDQLQATARQVRNDGGTPETTYYVYDSTGERVRKVTECQAESDHDPVRKDERIYLGGFERCRRYKANGTSIKLERETLHIMDDKQRIAMVETKTIDTDHDPSPVQLVRYQINNHLGSSTIELDDQARIISYEEYYPYGGTAYQAKDAAIKAVAKRYRYTGKERDGETGLYYYGARYYAAWLGRWVSCDPIGIGDSSNLYVYVHNNFSNKIDSSGMLTNDKPQEIVFPAVLFTVLEKKKVSGPGFKHSFNLKLPSIKPLSFQPFLPGDFESEQTRPCSPYYLLPYLKGDLLMSPSYTTEIILDDLNFEVLTGATYQPYTLREEMFRDVFMGEFVTTFRYLNSTDNNENSESNSSMFDNTTIGDFLSFTKKYKLKYILEAIIEAYKLSPAYKLFTDKIEDYANNNISTALIIGIPLVLALNYSGTNFLPDVKPEFTSWETNQMGTIAFGFGSTSLPIGNRDDYFRFTLSLTLKDVNNLEIGTTLSIDPLSDVFGIVGGAIMKLEF